MQVIVSQKKESTLNHWNESFLKRVPSRFMLTSTWNISILPPWCARRPDKTWIFALVWMKVQIHSLSLGATFGALKAHKHCFKWNRTNQCRLASCRGVWKNELLSELFGSHWANKVKLNSYYKKMNVFFFTLNACQPVVGDSLNQNVYLS